MNYEAEEERFGLALDRIAATAALSIDGDAHRRIQSNADAKSPEFQRIRGFLDEVRRANYLPHEDQIYTFNVVGNGDLRFAVMLQQNTFVGDKYQMVPDNVPVLMRALDRNMGTTATRTEPGYRPMPRFATVRAASPESSRSTTPSTSSCPPSPRSRATSCSSRSSGWRFRLRSARRWQLV
jgi:hypothetical protein